MRISAEKREKLIKAILEIGAPGATVADIAERVKHERHTVAKHLDILETQGYLRHKNAGKSKIWVINKVPIEMVLAEPNNKATFAEHTLQEIIKSIPLAVILVDSQFRITFCNEKAKKMFNLRVGDIYYKAILGKENPLTTPYMIDILDGTRQTGQCVIQDSQKRTLSCHSSHFENTDKSASVLIVLEDITKEKSKLLHLPPHFQRSSLKNK